MPGAPEVARVGLVGLGAAEIVDVGRAEYPLRQQVPSRGLPAELGEQVPVEDAREDGPGPASLDDPAEMQDRIHQGFVLALEVVDHPALRARIAEDAVGRPLALPDSRDGRARQRGARIVPCGAEARVPRVAPGEPSTEARGHGGSRVRVVLDEAEPGPFPVHTAGDVHARQGVAFGRRREAPAELLHALPRLPPPALRSDAVTGRPGQVAIQDPLQPAGGGGVHRPVRELDALLRVREVPPPGRVHVQTYDDPGPRTDLQYPADLAPGGTDVERIFRRPQVLEKQVDLEQLESLGREQRDVAVGDFFPCPAAARHVRERVQDRLHGPTAHEEGGSAAIHPDLGGQRLPSRHVSPARRGASGCRGRAAPRSISPSPRRRPPRPPFGPGRRSRSGARGPGARTRRRRSSSRRRRR